MQLSKTNTWVCTVCGYVHHGPEPPDICPICGATSDLFEPQEEPEAQAPAPAVTEWRCLNCEYIHEGDQPPETGYTEDHLPDPVSSGKNICRSRSADP